MSEQTAEQYVSGPLAELFAQGVGSGGVSRVLQAIRKHLGMDVAFISRFRDTDRVLESVDPQTGTPLFVGQCVSLEHGYCQAVVRGELPQLIVDTAKVPKALEIPETTSFPIGSQLSVPIVLEDGSVYGTLCCLSYEADLTLGERDLKMMEVFAEVLASRISDNQQIEKKASEEAEVVKWAMRNGAPRMVYQPLYWVNTGKMAMLECLSRFDSQPYQAPDRWFSMAYAAGMGRQLELAAIQKALEALHQLPADVSVTVNASPELVMCGELQTLLQGFDASRIVLEITEHAIVEDYKQLGASLRPLREMGLKLAIDDAGAGYASMRHIVDLHPDLIKLDMSLTRNIDTDSNRRALARALISFAREIGCEISAEGVETEDELRMLEWLGVDKAQGYFLGKPMPLDQVLGLRSEGATTWPPTSELAHNAA